MVLEQTLVLLKHDAVQRNILGKIMQRFEDAGFKIKGMKMVHANAEFAAKHYQLDEVWAKNVYEKTKAAYDKERKKMEYTDHMHLGKTIQAWNMTFLSEGPVIALVLEAPHAVELVRKWSVQPNLVKPNQEPLEEIMHLSNHMHLLTKRNEY